MSDSPFKMPAGAANKRRNAERNAGNGQPSSSHGPAAYDGPNDPPAPAGHDAQMAVAKALQNRPSEEIRQLLRNVDFGGNAYAAFSQVSHSSVSFKSLHILSSSEFQYVFIDASHRKHSKVISKR